MSEPKQASGVGWLLLTQGLLGVLIYVALSIYPRSRSIAMALGLFIVIGMFYSGWRGIKTIWGK
jgi:hypothetical protein